jgi:hypothetical protein
VEIYDSVREPGGQRPERGGRKIAVRAVELSAAGSRRVLAAGTPVRTAIRQVPEADRSRHPAPAAHPRARRRPEARHMTGLRASSVVIERKLGPMPIRSPPTRVRGKCAFSAPTGTPKR